MFSASRTPRTVTASSDITNNLVDTKPDLSAGKERVPAKAHQRAPSNKAEPSKAAAATASLAKPIEPVKPVKPGKSKSSGVVAVAKDDNSLDASSVSDALTTNSDKEDEEDNYEGENSFLRSDARSAEKESDYLQKQYEMSTSKRQRTAELDDYLLLRPERRTKVPRISVQDLHFPDLSDEDSMASLADYFVQRLLGATRPCKPNDVASSIPAGMGISASPHMLCCAQVLLEDAELRSRPGLLRLCLLQMRGQHELQTVVETLGEEIKALRSTVTKQGVDSLKVPQGGPSGQDLCRDTVSPDPAERSAVICDKLARPQEALLRFGTVQRDYWNANPDFHSSALSIYANVLSTARSDLHKLIRRTHLDGIDIVQALQIWYKDHPLAYTDEHLMWWSVLCIVKRHEGGEKEREYWQVHSTVANDLATKAARHHGSKRYCPDGMFDCATYVHQLYYPDSQHPKMMQAKVSTTDSSFQAVCTSVLGTYQPSADFRHLVLDRVREMAEGTLKGQDGLKHGE
ncbi:BZ3500_MvSof-1268-A1-R1_Chr1-2g01489 [Microbotryum saponariae]|uniref:BZ3500_MvSof-1268-A1-R1_Chr1-2g01489 protein n=1 Tax=Microbotryum saponariae TaxID=289078 RepID=A0A2X0KET1_9BASI|nr:BZ3500_MvSof-1268-A1-R1_Chr1-2g01489 [Microbotryum saponariae]SCZ97497.1 BZ3501_MvSof-1269-A2-R1_Chr1-2g01088 [Microbotryum saponariae]